MGGVKEGVAVGATLGFRLAGDGRSGSGSSDCSHLVRFRGGEVLIEAVAETIRASILALALDDFRTV